jgi:tetratricopeptide (TPR) repeat protein
MAYPESGPTSSYSDPIYDRLDTFAQAMRRRWWIYVVGLLVIVVAAQLIRLWVSNRPEEASSAAFNAALGAEKPEDRVAKLHALAGDEKASAYYRSRAFIELVQNQLQHDDATAGKQSAEQAMKLADQAKDVELQYAARLSRAASEFQLGEFDTALADYGRVETAGARYGAQQIEATLGAARTLVKQGKRDEAITKLEPLLARSDAGAETLLSIARVRYWQLKREQAEAAQPAPQAPASGAQPAGAQPAAPASATPAQPQASQPAQLGPAAAPQAQPAAPASPAPAQPAAPASAPAK